MALSDVEGGPRSAPQNGLRSISLKALQACSHSTSDASYSKWSFVVKFLQMTISNLLESLRAGGRARTSETGY